MKESKKFSLIARVKSHNQAWRGLGIIIKTTHNFWIQIVLALVAIYLGFNLAISLVEWLFIIFSFALVMVTEAVNTAFEIDIDLTSPEFHPYARDTKDVAAGAVLLSAIFGTIVCMVIFIPKILFLLV